jgi:methyl-accepting chemotaxis protein
MEEMTSIVKQSAENARQANDLALQARDVAQSGGDVVHHAVASMNEINSASERISEIVSVIDEIAFQTNLLALNAAVEAARVGEQGRGFAVVASEVRNLAGRSSSAAKEIKALVLDSVSKVGDGSRLVSKSGEQLVEIVAAVDKVAAIVAEISSAAQEQAAGIDQVNKAVIGLDAITQQNAALVEEATAASQAMSFQAADLSAEVAKFRLNESLKTQHQATKEPPTPKPAPARTTNVQLKVVGGGAFEEF